MTQKFLTLAVDGQEYDIFKEVVNASSKETVFNFYTQIDDEQVTFQAKLTMAAEQGAEGNLAARAHEELMVVLEQELVAELTRLLESS